MHFEVPHTLGKEEAIRRIDKAVDDLSTQALPAGVKVKDFTKSCADNVLKISFWAGKGFLGASISMTLTVTDNSVAIDVELPAMLKAFVAERQIEEGIRGKITPLLT